MPTIKIPPTTSKSTSKIKPKIISTKLKNYALKKLLITGLGIAGIYYVVLTKKRILGK